VVGSRPTSIDAGAERQLPDSRHLGPAERWLSSRAAAATEAVDVAMAEHGFGDVTRTLYDAIWNEYCDWGLEVAKVRLSDESLPVAAHEATWWTLVEVLDTYLRLLHPVMPFITEALWAAIPHRATDPALLIVARWPGVGERDQAAETEVDAIVELIRAIRNARSEAHLESAAWLPIEVAVSPSLGPTFEALRPVIERLTRARPLDRRLSREALSDAPGALTVIAGDTEARIVPTGDAPDPGAAALERARLERELTEAEGWLDAARARLANEAFTAKAPPTVVDGARAREAELAEQVERLRDRLSR
jgi:valyl-tRNA synthetase